MLITGGISNETTVDGNGVVTRVNSNKHQRFINREAEIKVNELFRAHTLPIISIDENEVKSRYVNFVYYDLEEHLTEIVYVIRRLHNLSIDYVFNPFELIRKSKVKIEYDKKRIKALEEVWETRPKTLCHNDLLLGNIGYSNGKFLLYDFEFTGMNDRYFDIASFVTENNLFHLEETLCQLFGVEDLELLKEYYYLNDVLWTMWGHELGHQELVKDKEWRLKNHKY